MVKKLICIKHAEDCYALQEAVRFVVTTHLWWAGPYAGCSIFYSRAL